MKRKFFALTAALTVLGSAAAAATCADRTHVVTQLEERFGETLYANSISSSNNVLEVYASPEGNTWSILVYLPERKLSCLAATGKGMSELQAVLKLR